MHDAVYQTSLQILRTTDQITVDYDVITDWSNFCEKLLHGLRTYTGFSVGEDSKVKEVSL